MIPDTGCQVRLPFSPRPWAYTFWAINTASGWMRARLSRAASPSLLTTRPAASLNGFTRPIAVILPRLRTRAVIGMRCSRASQTATSFSHWVGIACRGIGCHTVFAVDLALNRALAQTFRAGQNPAEDGFVLSRRSLRVRESQQVAVRPTVTLLVLHRLVSQLVGFLIQVPAANRVAQNTAPAAQSVHILSEVEQVGADAADFGQVLEGQSLGFRAAVSRHQGQRKNSRVVLRRPTATTDLDDALHGANTVGHDAADNCVVVLLHQVALADVVSAPSAPRIRNRANRV